MSLLEAETGRPDEALVLGRFAGETFPNKGGLCNHALPALGYSIK